MAASVDNRRFTGAALSGRHRSVSPARSNSYTFPSPFLSVLLPNDSTAFRHRPDSDDNSDDDVADWKKLYGGHLEVEPSVHDPRDEGTPDSWIERNPSLIRLTGKHPFNCEPPVARLMHHGFLTPVPLHYVRNHGVVPHGDWDTWTVEIAGLVNRPKTFSMDELVNCFPSIEIPVTLVCAGNRRKEQNMVQKTIGFNWGPAAISTTVWRGVRLCDVLSHCGITSLGGGAAYVCFEGAENLPGGGGEGTKYGTSLRREVAMDPSRDIMIAYMQNWEKLTPDHGFPVRVIIPGFIGGRMVKWLHRIIVTPAESDNHYHYKDNRVLPPHVDAELADAEAWWYKPEYIINELNINSAITTPGHDEILPINHLASMNSFTMKGYAYSGGGKKVTKVELSLDEGKSWVVCDLDHSEKPNKYGKYWCWCFWSVDIEVFRLLNSKEIAVRAWDESHSTQPENLIWNVMGMMNNCWFRVKISVCRPCKGEIGLVFEHPIQPGNKSGGWAARQKHLVAKEAGTAASTRDGTGTGTAASARGGTTTGTVTGSGGLKKSASTQFMNASTKQYTMSEVRKHSTKDSTWIVVHRQVYDCTSFVKDHPGGADSILNNAGGDCSEEFDDIHSGKAKSLLNRYWIGEFIPFGQGYISNSSVHGPDSLPLLATIRESSKTVALLNPPEKVPCRLVAPTEVSPSSVHGPGSLPLLAPIRESSKTVALVNPREKVPCRLVALTEVSPDVRLFRFALPSADQLLGLATGKHIFLCASLDGNLCMRAYTPTSTADEVGHFDLLVKVYFKGVHPKFPNGGLMSQHLDSLAVGAVLDIKGPFGQIEYIGRGSFVVNGRQRRARKLAMIAGGTGITPMYQVIQAVLQDPEDKTEMYLIYANRSEDDILLREELDHWAALRPEQLKVWYVINEVKRTDEEWRYSVGFVTEEILKDHIPAGGADDVLALACGPPPMIQFAVQPNLQKLNYNTTKSLLLF